MSVSVVYWYAIVCGGVEVRANLAMMKNDREKGGKKVK